MIYEQIIDVTILGIKTYIIGFDIQLNEQTVRGARRNGLGRIFSIRVTIHDC